MRIYSSVIAVLSSLTFVSTGSVAFAGGCGIGGACNPGVVVNNFGTPDFDPMSVNIHQPFGHLNSIQYRQSPNVSITRVHGIIPQAAITDAPTGFSGGCHPTSTQYCRQNVGTPVSLRLNAAPTPQVSAPLNTRPVVQTAPQYESSRYQSRQYGDTGLTPGTAYIPTSIVNRNPADAQAVLNSGRTVAQSLSLGGQAPNNSMISSARYSSNTISQSGPVIATQPSGVPASPVAPDGTYWEQVSGPTMFGNTLATKVVCKRRAPRSVVTPVQVVRPIVRVPVPVRYPVPVSVPVGCAPAHAASFGPTFASGPRFGAGFGGHGQIGGGSRWVQ